MPIHQLQCCMCHQVVRFSTEAGLDKEKSTHDGATPLHIAAVEVLGDYDNKRCVCIVSTMLNFWGVDWI